MKENFEILTNKIKELDFAIEKDNENLYTISKFSPCGQDCNVTIDTENDVQKFINNLETYANNFDVSYEASLWLDELGHGKNGAPYDMKDVYEDMEWWKTELKELATELENILIEKLMHAACVCDIIKRKVV